MLLSEPTAGMGGCRPGLLPMLLALLRIAWAEMQSLQLREEQAPMPGGKEHLGEERGGGAMSSTEECWGISGSQFPGLSPGQAGVV